MKLKQLELLKIIVCIFASLLVAPTLLADNLPAPAWYRYYDSNGVATISSSVSATHIRRGYDVLDRRMQVLRHVPAFNSEKSQQNAQIYSQQSKQRETDLRLKQAYTSSRTAEFKKQEALNAIKVQINIQQRQGKDTYLDQIALRREEQEYIRQGKSVPASIKTRLQQNDQTIERSKTAILNLQNSYRDTQLKYNQIISRLKLME